MMRATMPASKPQPADEFMPTARPTISGRVNVHGEHGMRTAYPMGYLRD